MMLTLNEALKYLESLEGKTTLSNEDVCVLNGVETALKMIAIAEKKRSTRK